MVGVVFWRRSVDGERLEVLEGSRWAGAETRRVGRQFNGPGTYSAKMELSHHLVLSNEPPQ